ncbi:response regulator [Promethearchaeum syntrophicum]|uniref:Response regulator n=1 Tax=Promethearchaeum syntrophicum TaxID=2594042 RepID=A0A5B9D8Z2_9ARCH|nr:response regulator [Candidatus Prometheoarchaeum syntrophicum]QEE15533.1 Response regulator receiver domain protein [Candidatus Prometheoarchaeum syntrophicum]
MKNSICGFYWIRSSGIPFFKWFSEEFFEKKWNTDNLFFSGFFSALNSSADTFFENSPLSLIEFADYRVYCNTIRSGDIFVLITLKDFPKIISEKLMNKMVEQYYETVLSNDILETKEEKDVRVQFLKYIDEIEENIKDGTKILTLKEKNFRDQEKKKSVSATQLHKNINQSNQELQTKVNDLESKIKSIDMVTKTIAHTFNNLLSSILGYVSLLKVDYENAEFFDTLEEMEHSSLRARDLTSQLLTLVKSLDSHSKKIEGRQKKESLPVHTKPIESDSQIIKGRGRILVLDDEKTILDVANKMLSHLGYNVSGAIFLEQAIEMYRVSLKKGRKYAAVILDLSELGGSEGYGLKLWKEVDPDVKTIISSGYADDPIFEDYKKYGIKAVLKKPYDIAKLSKILYEVISSK